MFNESRIHEKYNILHSHLLTNSNPLTVETPMLHIIMAAEGKAIIFYRLLFISLAWTKDQPWVLN